MKRVHYALGAIALTLTLGPIALMHSASVAIAHPMATSALKQTLMCQYPGSDRSDGRRVSSGSISSGWRYEIWRSDYGMYYIRAWRQANPTDSLFTAGDFASHQAAVDYYRACFDYYNQIQR